MVNRVLAWGPLLGLTLTAACHDEVTDGLRFTCARDDQCTRGWFCGAEGFCERGTPDTRAEPETDASDEVEDTPDATDARDVTDTPDVFDVPDVPDVPEVTDASDITDSNDAPDPGSCESLTHAVGRPAGIDSELVGVRDFAFDAAGNILVADLRGLVGSLAATGGTPTLMPIDGLTSPFQVWSVAAMTDGTWVVLGLAEPNISGPQALVFRFGLGQGDGVLYATDVAPIDLGTSTASELMAPPTAFLVYADLSGSVWLVEPEGPASYHTQPIFGDLLEPSTMAFDAAGGTTYIGSTLRGRVTVFASDGARSTIGPPGTFPAPEMRTCVGLSEGDACLGTVGAQGTCVSGDVVFCHPKPNVVDPRVPVCEGKDLYSDCYVQVAGESFEGDCAPDALGGQFCYFLAFLRSEMNVCDGRSRGDGCVFLGEPRVSAPPPFGEEVDADQDGIEDDRELDYGLDPDDPDSDDDGTYDGYEPDWAFDLDRDGTIAAKDLDSDGDDIPDTDEYAQLVPRYGNCLTASEIGRRDLPPEKLVCVDPTAGDPFDRPFVTGFVVHPECGLVASTFHPGSGAAQLFLASPGQDMRPLTTGAHVSALAAGRGGRFPATTLYGYDLVLEQIVALTLCDGPCP